MGFVMPLVLGLLGYIVIAFFVRAPGRSLQQKFIKLGNFAGMTYEEISKNVGPCNSESPQVTKDGETIIVRQWISTGYHISLIFKDGICIAKNHESSV